MVLPQRKIDQLSTKFAEQASARTLNEFSLRAFERDAIKLKKTDYHAACNLLGMIATERNDRESAIANHKIAVETNLVGYKVNYVLSLSNFNMHEQAESLIREILQEHPVDLEIFGYLVVHLWHMARYKLLYSHLESLQNKGVLRQSPQYEKMLLDLQPIVDFMHEEKLNEEDINDAVLTAHAFLIANRVSMRRSDAKIVDEQSLMRIQIMLDKVSPKRTAELMREYFEQKAPAEKLDDLVQVSFTL